MVVYDSQPFTGDDVETLPIDIVEAPTPAERVPTTTSPSPTVAERREQYQQKHQPGRDPVATLQFGSEEGPAQAAEPPVENLTKPLETEPVTTPPEERSTDPSHKNEPPTDPAPKQESLAPAPKDEPAGEPVKEDQEDLTKPTGEEVFTDSEPEVGSFVKWWGMRDVFRLLRSVCHRVRMSPYVPIVLASKLKTIPVCARSGAGLRWTLLAGTSSCASSKSRIRMKGAGIERGEAGAGVAGVAKAGVAGEEERALRRREKRLAIRKGRDRRKQKKVALRERREKRKQKTLTLRKILRL